MTQSRSMPAYVKDAVNLASAGLGAAGISASDEFFAPLSRMLADKEPIFIADKYDDHGKWMDGWETRRRRDGGHDHAIIRLATAGTIQGFGINTAFFTGNYPPACMIEGCFSQTAPDAATNWQTLLPETSLNGDAQHFVDSIDNGVFNHLRLHIFPDGGIARLRVYGQPFFDWGRIADGEQTDLAGLFQGGRILAYSNAHYGQVYRLLAPGRGVDMGDGWETQRRRGPGHDWILIQLGHRGLVQGVTVDTAHFKGNYPDRASLQAIDLGDTSSVTKTDLISASTDWPLLLSEQKLTMDKEHHFEDDHLLDAGPVSHVRLNIFPDGGVSRLRIWGQPR